MIEHVDLVIVGGGPGGASAAEAALREKPDLQVVILEKRARPHGTCAGGVGKPWLDEMGLKLPEHLIETRTRRAQIHGPTETTEITAKQLGLPALGYTIDRWGFDQWLLSRAESLGARVLRRTTFQTIQRENGAWLLNAADSETGDTFELSAPYVVDASGPGAVVAKQLGFKINEKPEDIHTGLQRTVRVEPTRVPDDLMEFWFKRDPTPESPWACRSGYVWSFPSKHPYWDGQSSAKRGSYTRIGVGVDQSMNKTPGRGAKECLDAFVAHNARFSGEVVSENGGLIPTGNVLQTAFQNVFVVGDAGRHVSALHGGGIWFSRVAGEEAGRAVAHNSSAEEFEKAWRTRIGFTLDAHYAGKKILYSLDNDDIDTMIIELGKFKPESGNPVSEIPRAISFMARNPRLGSKAAMKGFMGMLAARANRPS